MKKLKVLQWNMGVFQPGNKLADENRLIKLLQDMLVFYQPDLVVLQEVPFSRVESIVRQAGYDIAPDNKRLATAWKLTSWGASALVTIKYDRVTAIELTLQTPAHSGIKVLVCNVHLPSQLHNGRDAPRKDLGTLAGEIREFRTRNGQAKVAEILLGDFNLDPFEDRLRDEEMIHGNPSWRFVESQENKRNAGDKHRYLYSPAWQLYGAQDAPHGTLYYTGASFGGPWFIFDQALFSGELISAPAHVELVTSVPCSTTGTSTSLLSKKVNQPDRKKGSDHFPIVWTVVPKP